MSGVRRIEVDLEGAVRPNEVAEELVREEWNLNERTCAGILGTKLVVMLDVAHRLEHAVVDGRAVAYLGLRTEVRLAKHSGSATVVTVVQHTNGPHQRLDRRELGA